MFINLLFLTAATVGVTEVPALVEATRLTNAALAEGRYKQVQVETCSAGYGLDVNGKALGIVSVAHLITTTYPLPIPGVSGMVTPSAEYSIALNGREIVKAVAPEQDTNTASWVAPITTRLVRWHTPLFRTKELATKKMSETAIVHVYAQGFGPYMISKDTPITITLNGAKLKTVTGADADMKDVLKKCDPEETLMSVSSLFEKYLSAELVQSAKGPIVKIQMICKDPNPDSSEGVVWKIHAPVQF